MYNIQLRKLGILQVREQTQIEKCVWNLSCYIVEAPIPKQCKTILLLLCIDKKKVIITRLCDT